MTLYIVFASLLLSAVVGLLSLRAAHREHRILLQFRHSIERAAAPGEMILMDDGWLMRLLHPDSELRQRILLIKQGYVPEAPWMIREEFVVVATEGDPLLSTLRDQGFVLTQDELWDEGGVAGKLPVRGTVRIYFAVAPAKR